MTALGTAAAEERQAHHLDTRWMLDESVHRQAERGVLRKTFRYALVLTVGVVALEGLFGVAGLPPGLTSVLGEGAAGVLTLLCCLPLVRRSRGWSDAVGLSTPRWSDVPLAARWFGAQIVGRIAVAVVALAALPSLRHGGRLSNLSGLTHQPALQVALLAVSAVLIAPLIEEVGFRGLWLRTMMPQVGFWPAAIASSLLFGVLHAHEGADPARAALIAGTTAVFGLLQAMLVRRTGRLAPAILVHTVVNAVALAVMLAG
ncbi:MAG: Conserved rane protein of unknown function [Frankiales bacterium]|nr:Conserved rane protein of unknown function [Frankiales bacterium]